MRKEILKKGLQKIENGLKLINSLEITGYTSNKVTYRFESMYIYDGAFGNCQSFTINALNTLDGKEDLIPSFIKLFYEFYNRKQCVIDVHTKWFNEKLKPVFANHNISFQELPYVSTNKSEMTIAVLNCSDIKQLT